MRFNSRGRLTQTPLSPLIHFADNSSFPKTLRSYWASSRDCAGYPPPCFTARRLFSGSNSPRAHCNALLITLPLIAGTPLCPSSLSKTLPFAHCLESIPVALNPNSFFRFSLYMTSNSQIYLGFRLSASLLIAGNRNC